jgi:hypothetical protein
MIKPSQIEDPDLRLLVAVREGKTHIVKHILQRKYPGDYLKAFNLAKTKGNTEIIDLLYKALLECKHPAVYSRVN